MKKTKLFLIALASIATTLSFANDIAPKEKPPTGGITVPKGFVGAVDFTNAPKRINNKLPLSDQNNKENWKFLEDDSDEFNSAEINTKRWWPNNPTWKGRQPTFFHGSNVELKDGLAVFSINRHGTAKLPEGYTHTAGFIVSKKSYLYGYFEARLKANNSPWVAGFWLQCGKIQPDWKNLAEQIVGVEIDICENCPGVERNRHSLNSNVHAQRRTSTGKVIESLAWSKTYYIPFELQEDFHTWGLEWSKEYIRFYLDGVMFREVENKYWHYPQEVKINNESNKWFGALPDDDRLDEQYLVDYFRVWQKK